MTFIQLQPNPPNDLFQDRLKLFQVQQSLEQQAITKQALLRDEQSRAAFGTAFTAYQNNDKDGFAKSLSSMTPDHANSLFQVIKLQEDAKYQAALSASKNEETNQSRTEQLLKLAYPGLPKGGFDPVKGAFSESGASPAAQGALERARVTAALDSDLEIARKNYGDHLATLAQLGLSIAGLPDPKTATMNQIMNYEKLVRGSQGVVRPMAQLPGLIQSYIASVGLDPTNLDSLNDIRVQKYIREHNLSERNLTNANAFQSKAAGQAALMNAETNRQLAQQRSQEQSSKPQEIKPNSYMTTEEWHKGQFLPPSLTPDKGQEQRKVTGRNIQDAIDLSGDVDAFMSLGAKTLALATQLNLMDRAKIPYTSTAFSNLQNLFNSNIASLTLLSKNLAKSGALDRQVQENFEKQSGANNLWGRESVFINLLLNTKQSANSKTRSLGFKYRPNSNETMLNAINDTEQTLGRALTKEEAKSIMRSIGRGLSQ